MNGHSVFSGFLLSGLLCAAGSAADAEFSPLTPEQLAVGQIRVAAVQMTGNWMWQGNDDMPQATADQVVAHIDRAGEDGADLVVFPELLLGKFRVPCVTTDRIGEAARRNDLYVVVGCFEIVDEVGNYANSSLIFDRAGGILGRYFKTHPATNWPPDEADPEWLMVPGPGFPVFDLDFGRIGIVTCYDGYFPEAFRIVSLKGAEIILWLNARLGTVESHLVLAGMQQNLVHMICTNKALGAGTMIAEWPQTIREQTTEAEEAYIVSDLPLGPLRTARKYGREFFQRRPEIYHEILGDWPVWRLYDNIPALPGIELEPVEVLDPVVPHAGMAPGTALSALILRLRAPWMEGWAELYLPETLQSSLGCHFIDHYMEDVQQLSPLDPWPVWRFDEHIGEWSYRCRTAEGLVFSAAARPYGGDTVFLEFEVENRTGHDLAYVTANPCFRLQASPTLAHRWDLSRIHTWIDGVWRGLDSTTPTPEEKGREPWIIMRTREWPDAWSGPDDSATWWLLDQFADHNLLAVESADGAHLAACAWDTPPQVLMSNCGFPCLHTGPGPILGLADGESAVRRGRIYFVDNDPEALLRRFRQDKATWQRWPVR